MTRRLPYLCDLSSYKRYTVVQEDSISKVAKTDDHARKLIEAGFEYVCEIDGVKSSER